MGYKNREIESKLIVPLSFKLVCEGLTSLLGFDRPTLRVGSSLDTYWSVHDGRVEADFLRVRERDGIRQITIKGKDRGDNLNRIEVDIDSTSSTHNIHRLVRCLLGKPAGIIAKTYQVWELESEYDTVCCYYLTTPDDCPYTIVEVEARTEERMLELEQQVRGLFPRAERAPGSLYEMFVLKQTSLPPMHLLGKG